MHHAIQATGMLLVVAVPVTMLIGWMWLAARISDYLELRDTASLALFMSPLVIALWVFAYFVASRAVP
jgi:biotin transporter BioY